MVELVVVVHYVRFKDETKTSKFKLNASTKSKVLKISKLKIIGIGEIEIYHLEPVIGIFFDGTNLLIIFGAMLKWRKR